MRGLTRTEETSKYPAETQVEWDIGRKQQEMFGEIVAFRSVKPETERSALGAATQSQQSPGQFIGSAEGEYMKFKITMKDPDGVSDCIDEAISQSVKAMEGLSADDREALIESRREQISQIIGKWFEYQEYLTVEVDTDAMTCTVKPV